MSVFKCKMCGGTIEFNPGDMIGTCDSCGSVQTLPKVNDDVLTNLFNRANNLRLKAEFDKAAEIYEKIVDEDNTNAEAHWGIVLCKYGIEYVEDPASHKRIPTCHRAQYESIMTDADYIAALENSDTTQQGIYTQQAIEISNIQKGILSIVKDEKPFDVFICYKETDENGKRTVDSALANDIYYQLTQEGIKVFYAAITLEDKLGLEYEPYIFAALNSSKVMLVVGTKPEYFEAVWVRNEWSRFLKIMGSDRSKLLIPCYRDMDAYDLPEEFAHLQAQDMSKIGFVNDVVRGIKKVLDSSKPQTQVVKETTVINNGGNGSNTDALLKRAFMFLEDGKWNDADEYCEKVLDINPECAEAYLGKLMAELQVKKKDSLKESAQPFDNLDNCVKASRFDSAVSDKLSEDNKFIRERNETARKQGIYNNAVSAMNVAKKESEYISAAALFGTIKGFKDSDEKAEKCRENAEVARKDAIYDIAVSNMEENTISSFEVAIKVFESIIEWKDSRTKIDKCNTKIEEIRIAEEKAEAERKRKAEEARAAAEAAKAKMKKILSVVIPAACVLIAFLIVLNTVIIPKNKLKKAMAELDSGNYDSAYALLEEIGNNDAIASSKYDRAIKLIDSGDYDSALKLLNGLTYKDSETQVENCYIGIYGKEKWNKFKALKVGDTYTFGKYEQDNDKTNGKEEIEWRVLAKEENRLLIISNKAIDCRQYNEEYTDITWEKCTLRKWLNGTFYKAAFDSTEQSMIKTTKVSADANPSYSTNPGNDTNDKVFLLSITEVNKYFSSDEAMICKPTEYAKANGAYVNDDYDSCWWWLRSPGYGSNLAAGVYSDGGVDDYGCNVTNDYDCVRPALWIQI